MRKLEILLNKNCNMNCKYCGIVDNSTKEISQNIINLRSLLESESFSQVTILGGEPSINIDFVDVIKLISEFKVPIIVYTNSKISNNILHQIKEFQVSFIISYHRSQISKKEFMSNALTISKHFSVSIVIMWDNELEVLSDYCTFNILFKNLVSIEPVFSIVQEKMNTLNFSTFEQQGLLDYSIILNNRNEYLDKSFLEMYQEKIDQKHMICKIDNFSLTYNYQNNKTYKCLTYLLSNVNSISDNCQMDYCLCDMERLQ